MYLQIELALDVAINDWRFVDWIHAAISDFSAKYTKIYQLMTYYNV